MTAVVNMDKFDDKAIAQLMSGVDQHLGRNALRNMKKYEQMIHQVTISLHNYLTR